LEIRDLHIGIARRHGADEIVRGVDLVVAAGERVAVVGPSGCGKSSLIAVAAGLEQPTRGEVWLLGENVGTMGEDRRARLRRGQVSLVFQSFHLLPNMTAEENIAAPLEIAGARDAAATARAAARPRPEPPPSTPASRARWARSTSLGTGGTGGGERRRSGGQRAGRAASSPRSTPPRRRTTWWRGGAGAC
jgi:ABC-type dipeptide/oligopeptide/nickel transport system ATPase subunit